MWTAPAEALLFVSSQLCFQRFSSPLKPDQNLWQIGGSPIKQKMKSQGINAARLQAPFRSLKVPPRPCTLHCSRGLVVASIRTFLAFTAQLFFFSPSDLWSLAGPSLQQMLPHKEIKLHYCYKTPSRTWRRSGIFSCGRARPCLGPLNQSGVRMSQRHVACKGSKGHFANDQ